MVHEAGHALGLSDFSYSRSIDRRVAHPLMPDTVMNENGDVGVREPDCSPHPLDIMAIHALYQPLDP